MLSDYINNRLTCNITESIDYEKVYFLAKIHSMSGILSAIKNKYGIDFPETLQKNGQ